jgi:hypothetical protein
LLRIDQHRRIGCLGRQAHGAGHPVGEDPLAVLAVSVAGQLAVILIAVHEPGLNELAEAAGAVRALSGPLCPAQGGQEQGSQNANDGDNHQKLEQRETSGTK